MEHVFYSEKERVKWLLKNSLPYTTKSLKLPLDDSCITLFKWHLMVTAPLLLEGKITHSRSQVSTAIGTGTAILKQYDCKVQ